MKNNFTSINHLVKKNQGKNNPVSLPKETEPIIGEKIDIKEMVEHKVEEEIKPYVSSRQETIELPPDLKKIGVQSTTSTHFPSYQNITLPISDEKIIVGLHAPLTSSLRWLSTLAVYLLSRVHLGLKKVHGKAVRFFRP